MLPMLIIPALFVALIIADIVAGIVAEGITNLIGGY